MVRSGRFSLIFIRALLILFIGLSLIPSIFIDLFDVWSIYNAVFVALSLFFVMAGMVKVKGILRGVVDDQDRFGVFEKKIGLLLIVLTLFLALTNSFNAPFYMEGYKFITIFLVMLVSNELSKIIPAEQLVRDYTVFLAIYVIGVFAAAMIIPDALSPSGPTGTEYIRMDITGSETAQGVLSAVFLMLVFTGFAKGKTVAAKAVAFFVAMMAVYVFFFSGSRQALLAVVIYVGVLMWSGGIFNRKQRDILVRTAALLAILVMIFVLFTQFIDSSLYIRIFENPSDDYTTGRLDYSGQWMELMRQSGAPLGFGYISKHSIQEVDLLWPSSEFLRFYIEGGLLGIVVICLVIIYAMVAVAIVLKKQSNHFLKGAAILFFSVIVVQLSFDNYLHGTYKSLLYVLMLSLIAHHTLLQQKRMRPIGSTEMGRGIAMFRQELL